MKLALLTITATAILAACSADNEVPVDNGTHEDGPQSDSSGDLAAHPANVVNPTDNSGEAADEGGASTPPAANAIPATFHGRWGMVPLDCTGGAAAAKGLIAIDGKTITFYESRATLAKVTLDAPENFTGRFDFTGEGQTWTKNENLKLTNSSNTLIRSDAQGTYTYARCP